MAGHADDRNVDPPVVQGRDHVETRHAREAHVDERARGRFVVHRREKRGAVLAGHDGVAERDQDTFEPLADRGVVIHYEHYVLPHRHP